MSAYEYVDLYEGWNNPAYLGDTMGVKDAIRNIDPYVVRIWVYRAGQWLMYDPADPIGSDLETLIHGEAIQIKVTQDVRWHWTVEEPVEAFMQIIGVTAPPAEAEPGEVIDLTASIWNSGGAGGTARARIAPTPATPVVDSPAKFLAAGASDHFPVQVTMPDSDLSIMVQALRDGVIDSQMGPYTIKKKVVEPPPPEADVRNLNVGYAKV